LQELANILWISFGIAGAKQAGHQTVDPGKRIIYLVVMKQLRNFYIVGLHISPELRRGMITLSYPRFDSLVLAVAQICEPFSPAITC